MAQQVKDAEDRWQCNKSLTESMSYLLDKNLLTDVTFVVGPSQTRISAHKLVLAARSPVFYAMLEGPLAETGDINVPDIDTVTFNAMLRCLYSDDVNVNASNVKDMLYAAEKYDVDAIKTQCDKCLVGNTSVDPVGSFVLAEKYGLEEVRALSLETICKAPSKYLGEDCTGYLKLPRKSFHKILETDDLCLPELQVYFTTVRWAESECRRQNLNVCDENIRNVLGLTLYTIRFHNMTLHEFSDEVSSRKILSQAEIINVFQYMSASSQLPVDAKFNISQRNSNSESKCYRFGRIASNWSFNGIGLDALSFKIKSITDMKGVILYSGKKPGNRYKYDVSLIDDRGTALATAKGEYITTASEKMYELRFTSHVTLIPETLYTVTVLMNGPLSWYGMDGASEVKIGTNNLITFFNSSGSTDGTNITMGQIPGFIL